MEKIIPLKHLFALIVSLMINSIGFGQTTLLMGDITITGFVSDNPDQFSFLLLTDVTVNTTIKFTDNGWLLAGGFRDNEGTITWVADTNLSCGTEIIITDLGSNTYFATKGIATETNLGFLLATVYGDQILAYQGDDSSPNFIYAINFDNAGWSDATSSNDSALPIGLSDGVNAISLGQIDNATYNCAVTSDTSLILSSVSNYENWTLNDSPISIGGCYYSCVACSSETVIWNGTWSGTPDLTTQVIISADYNTETETSFSACAIKVESGATLTIANSTFIRVENDLTVEIGGAITVEHSGAFVQNNNLGNINNSGAITVNKTTAYAEYWYEYTYWSSPVYGANITNSLTNTQSDRRFLFNAQNFLDETKEVGNNNTRANGQDDIDDDDNDWQLVSESTIMEPGTGYASTHDKSIFNSSGLNQFDYTFEGPFNNGIITVPIHRNDSELNDNNWNFIGNPYPSAIDADLFLNENTNISKVVTGIGNTTGAIFLWSQNTPPSRTANGNRSYNFSESDYAIINGTGQTAGGDGVAPTRFIPSCQGFFVCMTNSASATLVSGDVYTANVTFKNSMRVSGTMDNSQFFKYQNSKTNKTSKTNKLWLNLTSDDDDNDDVVVFNQTLIGYINGASNTDDGSYFDAARRSSTNISPILYSIIDGSDKKFGIQGKAITSLNEDEVIKLGFITPLSKTIIYKISIGQIQGDFLTNYAIYLKDNLHDSIHNLSNSDYAFTSKVGEFNSRFEIVFSDKSPSNNLGKIDTNSLKIIDTNSPYVQFNVPEYLSIVSITIYNLLGKQLYSLKGNNSSETYNLPNLSHSIYFAKVVLSNGQILTKKAVKK